MSMPSGRDHGSGERRRYRAYVRGQGGYGAVGRSSPAPVEPAAGMAGDRTGSSAGVSTGRFTKHGPEETF